jgi:hypothetical protein
LRLKRELSCPTAERRGAKHFVSSFTEERLRKREEQKQEPLDRVNITKLQRWVAPDSFEQSGRVQDYVYVSASLRVAKAKIVTLKSFFILKD